MVCIWSSYCKEKLLFDYISSKSYPILLGCLLLLQSCIVSNADFSETPYHGPYLTREGVFLIKEIAGSTSEGAASERSWYMGQFDFSGHLEQSVNLTPFMGTGQGTCRFLSGKGSKLLYEFYGSHGTVYMIYDSFLKSADVLDLKYDSQQFAFSEEGSSLWIIRRENRGSFGEYLTHFSEIALSSLDTLHSFDKEGAWVSTGKLWKSGREMLCQRNDSLFSITLLTGFEEYLPVEGIDFTSFGDHGIVSLDNTQRICVMKKENVTIDTLYTYMADRGYSSISFSDDGLFMSFNAQDGFGSYMGLWDWEDQKTHKLLF